MNKNKKGFTLIELLVVVAIIAILSAIAFVSIQGARLRAFDTQIRAELSQVRSNAELWSYDVNGGNGSYRLYNTSPGWLTVSNKIPGCSRALLLTNDPSGVASYQLRIQHPTTASPQRYIAWAPLCTTPPTGVTPRAYCVDSVGNAVEVELARVRTVTDTSSDLHFDCTKTPAP